MRCAYLHLCGRLTAAQVSEIELKLRQVYGFERIEIEPGLPDYIGMTVMICKVSGVEYGTPTLFNSSPDGGLFKRLADMLSSHSGFELVRVQDFSNRVPERIEANTTRARGEKARITGATKKAA